MLLWLTTSTDRFPHIVVKLSAYDIETQDFVSETIASANCKYRAGYMPSTLWPKIPN